MQLADGERVSDRWQTREVDALCQALLALRTAEEMFSAMGADAFADRAHRELLATGESVRKRSATTGVVGVDLTPQELQVARLAQEGLSNNEIGGQLFISPRTVQYHLRKVFAKLGIRSRSELAHVLPRAARCASTSRRTPTIARD